MSAKSKRRSDARRHHRGGGGIPRQRKSRESLACPNCGLEQMCFLTWPEWADHARRAGEPEEVYAEEPVVDLLPTPWPWWWCNACKAGGALLANR